MLVSPRHRNARWRSRPAPSGRGGGGRRYWIGSPMTATSVRPSRWGVVKRLRGRGFGRSRPIQARIPETPQGTAVGEFGSVFGMLPVEPHPGTECLNISSDEIGRKSGSAA